MTPPIVFTLALLLAAPALYAQQPGTKPKAAQPAAAPAPAPPAAPTPAPSNDLGCRVLTGRVTDKAAQPLQGATVLLRSGTKSFGVDAFITNSEGQFMVSSRQPIPRDALLEVMAAGYGSISLPLANCQPLEVALEVLPGTRFKSDGRIKKTTATGRVH